MASLQAALSAQPDFLLARFWLAACSSNPAGRGEPACAHARADRGRAPGFLLGAAQLPAEARRHIDAAIAAVHQARAQALTGAAPAARTTRRRGVATGHAGAGRHVGRTAPAPPHPLQVPTLLCLPGLPNGRGSIARSFPFLAAIERETDAIRAEFLALLDRRRRASSRTSTCPCARPPPAMWRELNRSPRWRAYHFHRHGTPRRCAPASAARGRPRRSDALPLHALPEHAPGGDVLRCSRPDPHIPPHTGVINGRLTVHLPLLRAAALRRAGAPVARRARGRKANAWCSTTASCTRPGTTATSLRAVLIFDIWHPALAAAEREAMAAVHRRAGREFNRRHGAGDPLQE